MVSTRRLGFTGDVMLGRLVDAAYRDRQRPPAALWGDLQPRLRRLDGLCITLECALSTRGDPSPDRQYHFRAAPDWSTEALRAVTVDCCSLATDHAMDFGPDALDETLAALSAADVEPVGAGRTRTAARAPIAVDCRGLTVALVGFTDNTPADAATDERPGVAHVAFDPDDAAAMGVLRAAVSNAARFDPDLVVASLHWGPTDRTQPPPSHRAVARKLADWGVDLVAGHGGHCFQGIEVLDRGGSPTVVCYDMGGFVDDYAVDPTYRNDRGFLFELVVGSNGQPLELELRPTEIDSRAVYRASRRGATWCRSAMQERSAPFETTFDRAGRGLVVSLA
ncbi:CapA family protein [Halohasta salina]|uniref:CapA family protein n=1 Tax=Halohasta salina TaxID=2961621 RepID=UPI0020A47360|nr:CapA family protein [Halohasta salina]